MDKKLYPNQEAIKDLQHFAINAVAISSAVPQENIDKIKSLGLNLNLPANLIEPTAQSFVANTDQKRFDFLKNALYDNTINIIWALRGGYGATRIIPYLFDLTKPAQEKIVIGYSDITVLHLFLSQEWGWKTIHGIVLEDLIDQRQDISDITKITKILKNEVEEISLNELTALNDFAIDLKLTEGLLTGGNLTLIQISIGTKWQVQTKDKILFLEAVNMLPYQVERTLIHLLQANIFDDVKAVIFGDFSKGDTIISETLEIFARNLVVPVYRSFKFGHDKVNYPLIYNAKSKIVPTTTTHQKFELIMEIN